jgi:hypothetical protein
MLLFHGCALLAKDGPFSDFLDQIPSIKRYQV